MVYFHSERAVGLSATRGKGKAAQVQVQWSHEGAIWPCPIHATHSSENSGGNSWESTRCKTEIKSAETGNEKLRRGWDISEEQVLSDFGDVFPLESHQRSTICPCYAVKKLQRANPYLWQSSINF
jgi:hypothetical protein